MDSQSDLYKLNWETVRSLVKVLMTKFRLKATLLAQQPITCSVDQQLSRFSGSGQSHTQALHFPLQHKAFSTTCERKALVRGRY